MAKRNPNQRARARASQPRPSGISGAELLAQLERMVHDIKSGRLRLDKTTGLMVRHKPYWWRFGR